MLMILETVQPFPSSARISTKRKKHVANTIIHTKNCIQIRTPVPELRSQTNTLQKHPSFQSAVKNYLKKGLKRSQGLFFTFHFYSLPDARQHNTEKGAAALHTLCRQRVMMRSKSFTNFLLFFDHSYIQKNQQPFDTNTSIK